MMVPLEPDWCRFAGPMLPSSSSLTHGMLRALRSMVMLGPIAAGTVVVVCEPTPLGPIAAVHPLRYVPLHHGREPPWEDFPPKGLRLLGVDDAVVVVDGLRALPGALLPSLPLLGALLPSLPLPEGFLMVSGVAGDATEFRF